MISDIEAQSINQQTRPADHPDRSQFEAQSTQDLPWFRLFIYTLLFQLAWFWSTIPDLVREGSMLDTDDYQRLHQVRAWMAGQSWYDLSNYRMDPPFGVDMHWSRLVDMPIAALIYLMELFFEPVMADRIASILYPSLLLIAAVFMMVAICRRLDPSSHPLLVLLFTATCFTAVTEFRPGRLDHHSVQILLFLTMMLGLVSTGWKWRYVLIGFAIAASISVGLDVLLLIVLVLAWLGLEWALGKDERGKGLTSTAISLWIFAPLMLAVTLPPSRWLATYCDGISVVYVAALVLVGAMFMLLAWAGNRISPLSHSAPFRIMLISRLVAGAVLSVICAGLVLSINPACVSGPLGSIDPELARRWLGDIAEAKGLFDQMLIFPALWVSTFAYGIMMLAVSAYVLKLRFARRPEYLALFILLATSFLCGFLQVRALRIGLFASIPFFVVFWQMAWDFFCQRWKNNRLRAVIAQLATTMVLLSPTWYGLSALMPAGENGVKPAAVNAAVPEWKKTNVSLVCYKESQYATLAGLPKAYVMTDINTGPSTIIYTHHDVVGGPYHRNPRAILDMLDFFSTDLDNPLRIARERGIQYVAYCEMPRMLKPEEETSKSLLVQIIKGNEPSWLKRLSPADDRLHVFKVELP